MWGALSETRMTIGVYVCMNVTRYVCMYVCTYACLNVFMLECMYVCWYVCMSVCIYVSEGCSHIEVGGRGKKKTFFIRVRWYHTPGWIIFGRIFFSFHINWIITNFLALSCKITTRIAFASVYRQLQSRRILFFFWKWYILNLIKPLCLASSQSAGP